MHDTDGLLTRVRARLALAGALEDLQRGAAAGGVLIALGIAFRFAGIWITALFRPETLHILVAGFAVTLIVPLGGVLMRRYDRRALAARADLALGLQERVSTSVWAEKDARHAGPLAGLVVEDAAASASQVTSDALRRAFRPRLLRRDLATAGVALSVAFGLYLFQPPIQAGETEAEKISRLRDADRVADVSRRMAEQAKNVKEAAKARNEVDLDRVAQEIAKQTEAMARTPPRREAALRKLNELSDLARDAARKRAGLAKPATAPEAARTSRELAELLKQMNQIGLESLDKQLSELQKRLDAAAESGQQPSPEDLRDMAKRLDAIRKSMEAAEAMGAENLREKLQSIGNEDLLQKLAERMRELAARMEQDPGYQGLQSEAGDEESMDLSELSREELQELLDALDEMAGMEDLADMLREGGGEMSGGRKLRLGGSGGT
jgi:hypothetical protein